MIEEELEAMGYSHLRNIRGQLCGLYKFAFTAGLIVGLDDCDYARRYCYEHNSDAIKALADWDGLDHPGGPWIKVKGHGIDQVNPKLDL